MLSPRHIHFALLGLILGAATGYISAHYTTPTRRAVAPPAEGTGNTAGAAQTEPGGVPAEHPDVSDEQMLGLFKEAIGKNPDNAELLVRYANYLYDSAKYGEAVTWYEKALTIEPNNVAVRSDMGTALWNMGRTNEAVGQYNRALEIDPKHVLTLHNLFVVSIEATKDLAKAESLLKQMEQINPGYESLPALRKRLAESRDRLSRQR